MSRKSKKILKGKTMYKGKLRIVIVLSLFAFAMSSGVCKAQEWSRKEKTEIYGIFQTVRGDESSGLGVTIDFDDSAVYGLGIGYNIDDHWNINTELLFGSTDLTATGFGSTVEGDTDIFNWNVNLDYNIFKDRFTPVVSGGIGFLSLDGDFLGYDFSESNFSYNLGFGARWDISDNLMLKAMYRFTWTELEDADDTTCFDGVMISLGYMF